MSTPQYLQKDNINAAGSFVSGELWQDIRRVLMERRPEAALVTDIPDVAAAKGHKRAAFEECIKMIEDIPFEAPAMIENPFERPAVQSTAD